MRAPASPLARQIPVPPPRGTPGARASRADEIAVDALRRARRVDTDLVLVLVLALVFADLVFLALTLWVVFDIDGKKRESARIGSRESAHENRDSKLLRCHVA